MARFINPFPQFFKVINGAAVPLSDGSLTFYVNNTSTPADIFTDEAMTVDADNPQPLDANGRMEQNVFMSEDAYRIVLKDSDNATIWDKNDCMVSDTSAIQALIEELEALIESITSDLFSNNYAANGGMSVDNADVAGTPVSLTTSYVDSVTGFASAVLSNVSSGTVTRTTDQIGQSGFSMKYAGVSCTSAGQPAMRWRILSADAVSLSNKTLTLAVVVEHDVGATFNYQMLTYVANAQDNFAAVTSTGVTSTISVPSATATTVFVTGDLGDVSNGLEVIVKAIPNQALTTKNFFWSDVQTVISGVLLPFHPPIYREEQYRALSPDSFATPADLESLAERTYTSIVQVPTRERFAAATTSTWTIPAGVTAWNMYIQAAGGGNSGDGGGSSATYNSVTYTANGGQGASHLGGRGGNGDISFPGQDGVAGGNGGDSYFGRGETAYSAASGPGAGDNTCGGGEMILKRLVKVDGQNSVSYTVGASNAGGVAGCIIFEY